MLKLKCDILLSTSAFKFNLRRYTSDVPMGHVPPEPEAIRKMAAILTGEFGRFTTVRREMGQDIAGACGQLALKRGPGAAWAVQPGGGGDSGGGGDVRDIEDSLGRRARAKAGAGAGVGAGAGLRARASVRTPEKAAAAEVVAEVAGSISSGSGAAAGAVAAPGFIRDWADVVLVAILLVSLVLLAAALVWKHVDATFERRQIQIP